MSVDKSNKNKEANLKTLKDIEYTDVSEKFGPYPDFSGWCNSNELKEEAIKWIEELKKFEYTGNDDCVEEYQKIIREHYPSWEDCLNLDMYNLINELRAMKHWIKHFFNIKEEELE